MKRYLLLVLVVLTHYHTVFAQGTAFTYQGRLNGTNGPANGSFDLTFALFGASSGGSQSGLTLTNTGTALTNGLFNVTLDFGAAFFSSGTAGWLQIGVRTNGNGGFTALSPRQPIRPVPDAIFSGYANTSAVATSLSGTLPSSQLTGTLGSAQFGGTYSGAITFNNAGGNFSGSLTGNGAGLTNVNAATLSGLAAANFWQVGGNPLAAGQFLGSTNNQPLELRVNGSRALRLEPTPADLSHAGIVNVIAGSLANTVAAGIVGATIAGGGGNLYFGQYATNRVDADFGTVAGGYQNTAHGPASTVSGGSLNSATGNYGTVAGGDQNTAAANAFAAGHRAKAANPGAFVWSDSQNADFASTTDNQFLIRAQGGVGINTNNPNGAALYVQGSRAGTWQSSVAWFENASSAPTNAPALRVINDNGVTPDGALSVSANGSGLIARFGNAASFVSQLDTGGNWSANSFTGDGSGLTSLNASQLGSGNIPAARLPINLAFRDANQDFTGVNTFNRITVAGTRNGGWPSPITLIQNNSTAANASPALTVQAAGNTPDGAFSAVANGTGMIARFGTPAGWQFDVTTNGALFASGALTIDNASLNNGGLNPGLTFGNSSGEGLASKRTPGGNQYGLDLYTAGFPRLSVANNGNVGIGTLAPQEALHVAGGFLRVDGLGNESIYLGGDGVNNDVELGSRNSTVTKVTLYNSATAKPLDLYAGNASVAVLEIRGGSDLAEPFSLNQSGLPAGTVLVIDEDHPGQLRQSALPYDTRVAGIISGANGVHPGLTLRQEGVLDGEQRVALTGRVYAFADATSAPIRPGDLLTTSATPGHLMKASDRGRSSGAVLGKAMSALPEGRGFVLVLVSLQ